MSFWTANRTMFTSLWGKLPAGFAPGPFLRRILPKTERSTREQVLGSEFWCGGIAIPSQIPSRFFRVEFIAEIITIHSPAFLPEAFFWRLFIECTEYQKTNKSVIQSTTMDLPNDEQARPEQWFMTIVQLRNPTQNSKLKTHHSSLITHHSTLRSYPQFLIPRRDSLKC